MVKEKACVFISGSGTNLRSIIKNSREYNFPINIKLVISNQKHADGINFAKKFSIPHIVLNYNRTKFEKIATKLILEKKINLLCLAGFMKVLSKKFIRNFKGNIINIHPSLLPKYGGKGMYGQFVHKKVIENKEIRSGITIHFVNEKYDEGKIIFQKEIEIKKPKTSESLANQIHKLEMEYFPLIIEKLIS